MGGHKVADGTLVAVKYLYRRPVEQRLLAELASEQFEDPRNHCVPILDIIPIPNRGGEALIVMPLLQVHHMPPFEILDDFIEFAAQLLEVSH
jgi:hypothetical protein